MTAALSIWTVYDHPRDMPDLYVARLFHIDQNGPRPTNVVITDSDLTMVQRALEDLGLVKLMRSPEDEPQIVESWI